MFRRQLNNSDYISHKLYANESVLLLDETLIEEENGIRREVQPGKTIPFVMEPDGDKPWEYCGPGMSKRIHLYGTTLYDDLVGKYRMWYFGRMGPHWRAPACNYQIPGLFVPRTDEKPYNCNGVTKDKYGRSFVDNDRGDLTLYAESDDGINWDKPKLGIFSFNGSNENNIIWDFHGASVFIDLEEKDPDKRYKAIGFCRRYRNIFMITSPDGIHWDDKDYIEPVSRRGNEGSFNVIYDSRCHLFRAYSIVRFNDKDKRRVICYTESPSLEGPWKNPQPMLEPNSWDDEIGRRNYKALRAEFHNMSAFRYNNIYLGLLGVLYVTAEQIPSQENQMPCDGPIDSQIVYSRDGISWARADRNRTAAIPRGGEDAFDRGMILGIAKEPIIEGDEIHWYYTGCEHTHGELDMEKRVKRLGRATWQKDRFIALRAKGEGMVTTKTLSLPENTTGLEVNANAASGTVLAELCNTEGRILDGFSKEECVPLNVDELRWQVTWKNGNIAKVIDAVKLRFILKGASIYSFTFTH